MDYGKLEGLIAQRAELLREMREIVEREDREGELPVRAARKFDALEETLKGVERELREEKQRTGGSPSNMQELLVEPERRVAGGRAVAGATAEPFFGVEQRMAPRFLERVPDEERRDAGEVRFGALVAAMAGGQRVASQLREAEQRALLTMTGPGGGYVVPDAIGALFLDAVRPRTRVLEAGARTYPMEAPTVALPGWDDPVTAGWRTEGAAFHVATPTFREVVLQAKSVTSLVTVSNEIIEDALDATSTRIEEEMGRALAQALDLAALHGSGTDSEPLGLYNTSGIETVELGAGNGAVITDYDDLLDAIHDVEAANFVPTGIIWNPRTANSLRKLVTGISGDLTKLRVPDEVRALPRLATNQVDTALTVGGSSDCSAAFVGQWDRLVIGLRPDIGVRLQVDPYSQGDNGLVVIRASLRADVAVLDKGAFSVVTGIRA